MLFNDGVILVDPLRQDAEQGFERVGFVAHGDDRAREGLGLLATSPPEDQPEEPEQSQRAGRDRHPLGDGRRSQRLAGQFAPGGPGGVGDPRHRKQRQRPAEHGPPTGAVGPLLHFGRDPFALVEDRIRLHRVERRILDGLRDGLGAVRDGCHARQFTSFIKA